jgi:hypothetical protein
MARHESGQALAEFALIAPLLVIMLGGILYCGGLVIAQENLSIAARHAARRMALEGTEHALVQGDAKTGSAQLAVDEAVPGMRGIVAAGMNWGQVNLGQGRMIDAHMALYAKKGSIKVGKKSYQCGIGCLFYGVKVQKDLSRDLAPVARLVDAFSGHKIGGVATLGANGVMPGDLPPTGSGDGSVMGLNRWIGAIVNSNDKNL